MKDTEPIQSRKQYPSNDRNGEPIFEGDFVKGVGKHVGQSEVFFDAGQWQPFSYLNDFDGNNYELVKHKTVQSVDEAAKEFLKTFTDGAYSVRYVLYKDLFKAGASWQAKQQQETDSDFFHWSDCAVHNEPAMPNGKCDCEPMHKRTYLRTIEIAKQQQIVPELSGAEIRNLAGQAWEKDAKTNPTPINPYAFSYGFSIGYKAALQKQIK